MIEITGKPGDKNCRITFSPRAGFKRTHKTIERELVYGHKCPKCHNVVQALFLTNEPVNLWPYEETNVMSTGESEKTYGTVSKIVPQAVSKFGFTAYTSGMLTNSGNRGQHIVLKNHVLKYHGIGAQNSATDRYLETGERTCKHTGVFSLREDLIIRDVCLFMRCSEGTLAYYQLPTVNAFIEAAKAQAEAHYNPELAQFEALPAYGSAPSIVIFPLQWMRDSGSREYQMTQILEQFKRPKHGTVAPF